MYKKVLYNTAAQIFGKFLTAGSTLIVTIIVGRSLGEAGYGDFTKIFSFVGYFYTFADFGLNTIFVKKDHLKEQSLFPVLVSLRLLMAFFLVAIAIGVGFLLPYNPQTFVGFSPLVKIGIAIASFTILTHALYTSSNALFQKNLRYDLSTIAAVTGALTVLLTAICSYFFNLGLLAYAAVYVIGGATMVTVAFGLINRVFHQKLNLHFQKAKFASFMRQGWPVGLALVLNLIYFRIDIFVLSIYRPSLEVGLYGLAYQFFEASLAVPIFFSNALYPALISIKKENLDTYNSKFKIWLLLLTGISVVHSLALFVISFAIPLIYKGQFGGSIQALQILSLGALFFYLSALFWHGLIILGRQRHLPVIYGAGALFNLTANLVFIPVYGYMAAAYITILSEALILILLALDYVRVKREVAN